MGRYVEGFVLVVKKNKLNEYKKMATAAGKIWMKHGALDYAECFGMDLKLPKQMQSMGCLSFPKLAKSKPDENVVFSFITYKSKAHRDAVMKKVMGDKKLEGTCDPNNMPFDMKKMAYGGFSTAVDMAPKKRTATRKKR